MNDIVIRNPPIKKRKSSDIVMHDSKGNVVTKKKYKSLLAKSAREIYDLLEVGDNDTAVQLLYKRVIQSGYKMLAKIEASMSEGGTRGAYPFNAIAQTLRDYTSDLQASLDRGHLAENILDNILRPMFMEMASSVVLEMSVISKEAKSLMSEQDYKDFNANVVRSAQTRIIEVMQQQFEQAKVKARKSLQG